MRKNTRAASEHMEMNWTHAHALTDKPTESRPIDFVNPQRYTIRSDAILKINPSRVDGPANQSSSTNYS
jgi:hypothetical protein